MCFVEKNVQVLILEYLPLFFIFPFFGGCCCGGGGRFEGLDVISRYKGKKIKRGSAGYDIPPLCAEYDIPPLCAVESGY